MQKRDYKPPVGKERDQEPKSKQRDISTVKMYVGRYFTFEGEFDEERFHYDVSQHIKKLENGTAQREYSLSVKSD